MADLAKQGMLLLMSEKCYENYFEDFNFFDVPCFKALLSKGLGLGIIAGSMLVKVPQIMKILNNKSTEGLSLVSVFLDLMAITFHMSYSFVSGFPFSAWGDGTFLAFQTATIAALIFFYGHRSPVRSFLFTALYGVLVYILMGGMTPLEFLWSAQGFNVPILLVGKLSQAVTNYRNGGTGQLSAATCFMLFFGSLARIFTSIQETGDNMMILTYSVSTFANAVIIAQLLYYWNLPTGPKIPAHDVKDSKAQKSKKAKKAD
ncbi:CLUMA_CG007465, isoform A [Clunio marinus]|uniref:Mannose-P-dolichol utilization defect 1 protein homolog n=1 Tax=Clunio marinus TaxID=568069 RepID=A0A1J1I2E6_9DIPT|nr:CLUMA_CG007465, isoform A [Clunio marinus]